MSSGPLFGRFGTRITKILSGRRSRKASAYADLVLIHQHQSFSSNASSSSNTTKLFLPHRLLYFFTAKRRYNSLKNVRNSQNLLKHHYLLQSGPSSSGPWHQRQSSRTFMIRFVGRALSKVRYWILGGTLAGGTYAVNVNQQFLYPALQRFDEFRSNLPDLREIFPNSDEVEVFQAKLRDAFAPWADSVVSLKEHASDASVNGLSTLESWLLSSATTKKSLFESWTGFGSSLIGGNSGGASSSDDADGKDNEKASTSTAAMGENETDDNAVEGMNGVSIIIPPQSTEEQIQKLREELLDMQSQYQREIEALQKENRELRKANLLKSDKSEAKRRKIKESLIDLYSRVLDSLQAYDSSYSVADNLPRVVVVGDQSSGKTSVLEMIAQARIFPRGAGEMMTRSPVKVTLSEGPYHLASFRDSNREFDLTKDSELEQLRREIELRMRNSVRDGKTVSSVPISLTVKGPGLPRMVLVDLPGVISTVTTDMAKETKDDIQRIAKTYMENPNAIILCIQDGSVDAERSNVTDLVSSMDPKGRRTIMVLTKVDLAEDNLANPDRIRKILEGRLFPMKALGYYAVVTGRGNAQDSIATIREYEEKFFAKSKLFRGGVLKPGQMTTANMSMAVSNCFWKMVKDSIEQQSDAFRAARYNLETEWKNTFPRQRQLDREELYDRARGEILDEIVNLSQVASDRWNRILEDHLWDNISAYFFENIYLPASEVDSNGKFDTMTDIRLRQWIDKDLPSKSVMAGWETLKSEFKAQVEKDERTRKDHDELFRDLKLAVLSKAMDAHSWDNKALDYLRVIQNSAMEDRSIPDKKSWEGALRFMERAVKLRLKFTEEQLKEMRGPGTWDQYTKWQSLTEEQRQHVAAESELKKTLDSNPNHRAELSSDDITVVRKNLEAAGLGTITEDSIRRCWAFVYREHFLRRALQASYDCRSCYYHYKKGFSSSDVDCQAVPLFYRLSKMLEHTATALRQQITNNEQRRLEKEIKEVLEEWSLDHDVKKELLKGRRVELAEELKTVREIQEQLEEFVEAMKSQKS